MSWTEQMRSRFAKQLNEAATPPPPVDFTSLASAGAAHNPDLGVYDRLVRRFGMGADPSRRQKLYRTLVALVAEHGDRVYKIVCECAAEAASAQKPANYFCFAVTRRLKEAGITGPGKEFQL